MGVPVPDMEPVENATAEALLSSLETIGATERRKHASVFNYWLSIKGDRDFPPIRDLDPLEISEAGPSSILLEMVGGGEDATVRHLGNAIRMGVECDQIAEASSPSLLSCIRSKLPLVAACKQAMAFEDGFDSGDGPVKCWITLLPFSASGNLIDFVYGLVSLDPPAGEVAETAEAPADDPAEPDPAADPFKMELAPYSDASGTDEPETAIEPDAETAPESISENIPLPKPGLSAKFFESLANVGGFYGRVVDPNSRDEEVPAAPDIDDPMTAEESGTDSVEPEPATADEQPEAVEDFEPEAPQAAEPEARPDVTQTHDVSVEGDLESKLTEVRAKADEAQKARQRAHAALVEGLSAAYDFALDAEQAPEEYLRLVEAQGLKIQLRSPMQPVVKLAFDGTCDDSTVADLESVLAWALKKDLPRGTLAERIEAEGGISKILKSGPAVN